MLVTMDYRKGPLFEPPIPLFLTFLRVLKGYSTLEGYSDVPRT